MSTGLLPSQSLSLEKYLCGFQEAERISVLCALLESGINHKPGIYILTGYYLHCLQEVLKEPGELSQPADQYFYEF
jgi:hypothetical protein